MWWSKDSRPLRCYRPTVVSLKQIRSSDLAETIGPWTPDAPAEGVPMHPTYYKSGVHPSFYEFTSLPKLLFDEINSSLKFRVVSVVTDSLKASSMGILKQMWDDTLGGPVPDKGVGRLRKLDIPVSPLIRSDSASVGSPESSDSPISQSPIDGESPPLVLVIIRTEFCFERCFGQIMSSLAACGRALGHSAFFRHFRPFTIAARAV